MVAAVTGAALLLSLPAVALAAPDDLRDRQSQVEGGIEETLGHLDQSSAELLAATRELQAAQQQLGAAQDHLAKTRGELTAAVALDRRMQAELAKAVRRLQAARAELKAGQEALGEQERVLGQLAVQNYQNGDPGLMGLSMVLTTQNPAELTSQLNSVQNVLDKEAVTLDRHEASRVLLTVKEDEVEAAKVEVAAKRRAAAENLERKKVLEAEAEAAEQRVSGLVSARAAAHNAASQARAADLERLRGLQQERDKISDLLALRAEQARQRAAAAEAVANAMAATASAKSQASPDAYGFLAPPVEGYLTSPYGMRLHPVYKRWTLHDGMDFGASCGTPVVASAPGEVIAVYYNSAYGNRVVLDNGFKFGVGLGTAYNHLSAFSTFEGEKVKRGDVIGYVGNTGYSTGCHLHFMVFENGATINPVYWLGDDSPE